MNSSHKLTQKILILFAVFVLSLAALAGPVVIDGSDASDHGSTNGVVNANGWLYMQKVLENLAPQVAPGTAKVVVDIGTEPGSTARTAIDSAFALSSLPAAGWTIVHVNGSAAVAAWMAALSTSNTGILALPTANGQTSGDMDSTELAAINAASAKLAAFVGQGGGLFAMGEQGAGAFGWLTTLIPSIVPTSGSGDIITLTPAGTAAFPGLTSADTTNATPWHNFFSGTFGSLQVLALGDNGQPLILGGGAGTSLGNIVSYPSDQKAGAFLAFPYYNSKSGADTRLTISNTGDRTVTMHMFFLDSSCSQADQFVCLTPNASQTFLASEYDPENTGYLLAVAVSDSLASWDVEPGCPVPYNGLIGNAFVREGNYNDTYGAEAFWAHGSARDIARCDTTNWVATLNFNGSCNVGGYDYQPIQHVAEIQSPNDSVGQRIIVVGLRGAVGAIGGGVVEGAAQQGIGVAYNDGEKAASYSSPFGSGCQRSFMITPTIPRVPGGLGSQVGVNNPALIPSGRTGTLKWNTSGSVGLIMTPKQGTNKWSGIRTLHKTLSTKENTLKIPILSAPGC